MLQPLFRFRQTTPANENKHPFMLLIRVLTHNIRFATSSLFDNERPWIDRCPLIMKELSYHTNLYDGRALQSETDFSRSTKPPSGLVASFICLQEVLHNQLLDILNGMNNIDATSGHSSTIPEGPLWAHIGVGRADGGTEGEYSPILYPVKLFKLVHFKNIWLSPTPDEPSKGWDAGNKRVLTIGVFEHRVSKQRVAAFNTHLDNAGPESREKSVGLIVDVIERVCSEWAVTSAPNPEAGKLSFFLTGDFNSFPTQEAYRALVASNKMVDAHNAIPKDEHYGDENTFTSFQPGDDVNKENIGRIDYIWFGPKSRVARQDSSEKSKSTQSWDVKEYAVLPNVFDDGIFSSDHRSVVADAVLT